MPFYKQVLEQYNKLNVVEKSRNYFPLLATLVLLIILILLIFPAINHITNVNKEVSDARMVKAALENKINALDEAKKNLEEIRAYQPLLALALPVGSDLGTYLKKVEELTANHNLKIAAIQFSNIPLSKPSQDETLRGRELSYSLTLEGAFLDFQKFLIDLENYIRTSNVSTLNIAKGQAGTLKETLDITSFYLGVASEPTSKVTNNQTKTEVGGGQ